ncbi:DUF1203 domain-containing protein [Leucobacter coleopterorum]|uniref:DUF1203 domain-containing protein n=1 Tax=Leucobacter coleopterorum TaxID=2714933 RepID=A0ABX6JZT3_9MICO|nr:DUF1203 domain-containing protein [Leucobacter coleopterorum]QIM18472.1 DUF1203 domain-containing protein [Leucobacter coleopterorum]
MIVTGLDSQQLAEMRTSGLDHGQNAVEPFTDLEGGWPLRCCLSDSVVGDKLAIVAWNPFPWRGPFAETGPIVVHVELCDSREHTRVPSQFEHRRQLVRPYTLDHRIAYDLVTIVEPTESLGDALKHLVRRDDVERVIVRNVLAGCYSFTAVHHS